MSQSGAPSPRPAVSRRRTFGRSGCAAVLTGLAAFAALQLGTAVAMEQWFPGMIDPDYGVRLARPQKAHPTTRSARSPSSCLAVPGSTMVLSPKPSTAL